MERQRPSPVHKSGTREHDRRDEPVRLIQEHGRVRLVVASLLNQKDPDSPCPTVFRGPSRLPHSPPAIRLLLDQGERLQRRRSSAGPTSTTPLTPTAIRGSIIMLPGTPTADSRRPRYGFECYPYLTMSLQPVPNQRVDTTLTGDPPLLPLYQHQAQSHSCTGHQMGRMADQLPVQPMALEVTYPATLLPQTH